MGTNTNIIVITGPTASGKSSLALDLALATTGEIVNADSIQVYRYFDIGSAKPTAAELEKVRHHMISILNPDEDFNVGSFCILAEKTIEDITNRNKVPIIVGGTGLYIQGLLNGLVKLCDISKEAKNKLETIEKTLSPENKTQKLYCCLQGIDSKAAEIINYNDLSRIRRAILVMLSTGQSIVDYQQQHRFGEKKYNALVIALCPDKESLYHSINSRTDKIVSNGLISETREILDKYKPQIKPLSSIGYKSAVRYLCGIISETEMIAEIKQATRHYAKRQLTWWRNQPAKLGWTNLKQCGCQEVNSVMSLAELTTLSKNFLQYKQATTHPKVSFLLINSFG